MTPASLEALFQGLRHRGFEVTLPEILRAREVLRSLDTTDLETFENVLVALFAKREEDRATLLSEVRVWLEQARLLTTPSRSTPFRAAKPSPPPPKPRRLVLALAGLALALGVSVAILREVLEPTGSTTADAGLAPPQTDAGTADAGMPQVSASQPGLRQAVEVWVPKPAPEETPWKDALPPGLTGLLVGGLSIALWRNRHRRRPPPEPAGVRPDGPTHYFLQERERKTSRLLTPEEEDHAAWGVGRYFAETSTTALDLSASAVATARAAGEPRLIFERTRRPHSVWIWRDEATEDPTARALAEDLYHALTRAGVLCEQASFWGLPQILEAAEAPPTSPAELEDGRDGAIVLVLTDGAELELELARRDTSGAAQALLRELAAWPKLAFVRFGEILPRLLAGYDLRTLTPEEAVGFLGQGPIRPRSSIQADLVAWCAAAALNPGPQDDATLLVLRDNLGLRVSPWLLPEVREEADAGAAEHFVWPDGARRKLLGWLIRSEDARSKAGLLARAARFWLDRLEKEKKDRFDEEGPWADTPAARLLELAQARIRVFIDPEPAIDELYALYQSRFNRPIAKDAKWLCPGGIEARGYVPFPWDLDEVDGPHQDLLDKMGFIPDGRLEGARWQPHPLLLGALALTVTLSLSGLVAGLQTMRTTVRRGEAPPAFARITDGLASSPKFTARLDTSALIWRREHRPCIEELGGEAVLIRCGPFRKERLPSSEERRYAAVAASGREDRARDLAHQLVASGTADMVLVDETWWTHLEQFHLVDPTKDQLIVLGPGPPSQDAKKNLERFGRDVSRVVASFDALLSGLKAPSVSKLTQRFETDELAYLRGQPILGPGPRGCPPPTELAPAVELWTCGTLPDVDGPALRKGTSRTARRSLVYLDANPAESRTQRWVERLLDQGVADEVLVGVRHAAIESVLKRLEDDPEAQAILFVGERTRMPQLKDREGPVAVILEPDWTQFFERLNLMGTYSLAEVMADRKTGKPEDPGWDDVRLVGPQGCPYQEVGTQVTKTSTVQIPFVRVCGGIFTMGSNERSEERPTHQVWISSFWLQRHELTRREARAIDPSISPKGDGHLPLVDVSWHKANALCEKIPGGRLPTEAEWEYAARGWDGRRYPWGNPLPTKDLAAFGRGFGRENLALVEQHPSGRGPFGAFDQAGNVWEWVFDVYDASAYEKRGALTFDPVVDNAPGGLRVLRGGAYNSSAEILRSAYRFRLGPVSEFRDFGFRCVRGPRRQLAP